MLRKKHRKPISVYQMHFIKHKKLAYLPTGSLEKPSLLIDSGPVSLRMSQVKVQWSLKTKASFNWPTKYVC